MASKPSFLLVMRSKYFWQVLSGGKNSGEAQAYDEFSLMIREKDKINKIIQKIGGCVA